MLLLGRVDKKIRKQRERKQKADAIALAKAKNWKAEESLYRASKGIPKMRTDCLAVRMIQVAASVEAIAKTLRIIWE